MFRFTIRDVLWLMVVTGVAAAWLITDRERHTLKVQNAELVRYNSHLLDLVDRVWLNSKKSR